MGARTYERLIELQRSIWRARVWLAVPDPSTWALAMDVEAVRIISGVLYVANTTQNHFDLASEIETRLAAANFGVNAVSVSGSESDRITSLVYPDWP